MAISDRLQTVKKTRVYEAIVAQLTSLILEGEIKPGEKLPSERELCEQFGVGRNSVREATRSLESARLVETRQGEGTFVTAHPESMVQVISEKVSSDAESGIHHLFEARLVLEPQIAALAAERATGVEIEELEGTLRRQHNAVEGGGLGLEEDTQFHLGLAEAAKNQFLHHLLSSLLNSMSEMRERSLGRDESARFRSWEAHQEILDAVSNKDQNKAVAGMISHLVDIKGSEVESR
ncbi:MAG: FadR/GntR family transcriptional regulator [Nitrospinae bacterium]|nr:FadR/GntR family transcriptional regulator [Nitrospinota bacterium]